MAEEKPKSALDKAFETFEQETADCKVIRKELITQLREDAKKMRVSEYDKAMMIQAKMSVITTLNGMLKDVEDASIKKVKLHMSRTEQESNGQYSQAIVQLLKMVRADGHDANETAPQQEESDIQRELAQRGQDLKIEISPGELEECSGTPGEVPDKKPEESPKSEETK